jgi:hypothetical protein
LKITFNAVIFIVQINCNWLQWSNIKVYQDIFFIFFLTHLYIKKKLHSENKSSIYTETYIFDTYVFGTDYNVNPLSFLFNWLIIGVIKCGQTRIKPIKEYTKCY